jgi:hypothetical protein
MTVALKELEPFVRSGRHLYSGRPLKGLGGMLSREALANWLLCAVFIESARRPFCFTSDPNGGDGIIYDESNAADFPTEHIFVPRIAPEQAAKPSIDALLFKAVRDKESKGGAAYARGKTLVVFLDAGLGEWHPNKVARELPPGNFANVWVVQFSKLGDQGEYTYGVTCIRTGNGLPAPIWLVEINPTFEAWKVIQTQ